MVDNDPRTQIDTQPDAANPLSSSRDMQRLGLVATALVAGGMAVGSLGSGGVAAQEGPPKTPPPAGTPAPGQRLGLPALLNRAGFNPGPTGIDITPSPRPSESPPITTPSSTATRIATGTATGTATKEVTPTPEGNVILAPGTTLLAGGGQNDLYDHVGSYPVPGNYVGDVTDQGAQSQVVAVNGLQRCAPPGSVDPAERKTVPRPNTIVDLVTEEEYGVNGLTAVAAPGENQSFSDRWPRNTRVFVGSNPVAFDLHLTTAPNSGNFRGGAGFSHGISGLARYNSALYWEGGWFFGISRVIPGQGSQRVSTTPLDRFLGNAANARVAFDQNGIRIYDISPGTEPLSGERPPDYTIPGINVYGSEAWQVTVYAWNPGSTTLHRASAEITNRDPLSFLTLPKEHDVDYGFATYGVTPAMPIVDYRDIVYADEHLIKNGGIVDLTPEGTLENMQDDSGLFRIYVATQELLDNLDRTGIERNAPIILNDIGVQVNPQTREDYVRFVTRTLANGRRVTLQGVFKARSDPYRNNPFTYTEVMAMIRDEAAQQQETDPSFNIGPVEVRIPKDVRMDTKEFDAMMQEIAQSPDKPNMISFYADAHAGQPASRVISQALALSELHGVRIGWYSYDFNRAVGRGMKVRDLLAINEAVEPGGRMDNISFAYDFMGYDSTRVGIFKTRPDGGGIEYTAIHDDVMAFLGEYRAKQRSILTDIFSQAPHQWVAIQDRAREQEQRFQAEGITMDQLQQNPQLARQFTEMLAARNLQNHFGTEVLTQALEKARAQYVLNQPQNPRTPGEFRESLRKGSRHHRIP